jgi:hypothetical protein
MGTRKQTPVPWPPTKITRPSIIEGFEAGRLDGQQRLTLAREENRNMDCVNLRERFGRQYRVEYEESYSAQYGPHARIDDPWLQIVPCQHGRVYPHGGNMLTAATNGRGPIIKKLLAVPGAKMWQDGDDGANILFPVEQFEDVAKLMRARRRRRLSPEQRAKAVERLAKYAFPPARQNSSEGQAGVAAAKTV